LQLLQMVQKRQTTILLLLHLTKQLHWVQSHL
jgi:hypothetical protein